MPPIKARVTLLTHTPNPLAVIYSACRQCYSAGFVGDMWDDCHKTEADNTALSDTSQESIHSALVAKVVASGHTSPMEHVTFTFAAEGISRALSHQLVRHRIASYSQQSQRYVDGSQCNYIIPPAIAKNPAALARFEAFMTEVGAAYKDIKELLEADGRANKANEDARFVLPQAAETRIVYTMNCRALMNFFAHRCCTRAQWEIRALARDMLRICQSVLPVVFQDAGAPCEKTKKCPEGTFSCGRYPV